MSIEEGSIAEEEPRVGGWGNKSQPLSRFCNVVVVVVVVQRQHLTTRQLLSLAFDQNASLEANTPQLKM